jgi:hypothetical protein
MRQLQASSKLICSTPRGQSEAKGRAYGVVGLLPRGAAIDQPRGLCRRFGNLNVPGRRPGLRPVVLTPPLTMISSTLASSRIFRPIALRPDRPRRPTPGPSICAPSTRRTSPSSSKVPIMVTIPAGVEMANMSVDSSACSISISSCSTVHIYAIQGLLTTSSAESHGRWLSQRRGSSPQKYQKPPVAPAASSLIQLCRRRAPESGLA